jgi:CspA family cold shock protein
MSSVNNLIGCVKWFNNKAGYGFITVMDTGVDVFIHHRAIDVDDPQYKYLVQGEYVQFSIIKSTSGDHEWQASSVSGINGGKLMCETRREFKLARTSYNEPRETVSEPKVREREPKIREREPKVRETKERVREPRATKEQKKEWTLVGKRPTKSNNSN